MHKNLIYSQRMSISACKHSMAVLVNLAIVGIPLNSDGLYVNQFGFPFQILHCSISSVGKSNDHKQSTLVTMVFKHKRYKSGISLLI